MACSMHPRKKKCIQNSDHKNLKERDHLENLTIDKMIISKADLKEIGWFHLGLHRGHWNAFVSTVVNLWVS
jgi:hypothetical protein